MTATPERFGREETRELLFALIDHRGKEFEEEAILREELEEEAILRG